MRFSGFRAGLIAVAAVLGLGLSSAAQADSGHITFSVVKAGFVIGGSAGSGTLTFHGRRYPISIGGLSYGFTFGASETRFNGTVSNIRRPSDVAGVYAAAGYSGQGVAMAPFAGKVLADAIRGDPAVLDRFAALPVPRFPGGRLLRTPALVAGMTWYALRDRI